MLTLEEKTYKNRFPANEMKARKEVWKVLCNKFFQKYISPNDIVVDIGAGFCEFINCIKAKEKIAIDKQDIHPYASQSVKILRHISEMMDESVNVVFISNFLEHLESKGKVIEILKESYRILKPAGKILIIQPNIRFLYKEYWDFFDHLIPLSDKSVTEILKIVGFSVEKTIPRFLPYTTKSNLPKHPLLVSLYLKFPIAWKIMGKQAFILGRKTSVVKT